MAKADKTVSVIITTLQLMRNFWGGPIIAAAPGARLSQEGSDLSSRRRFEDRSVKVIESSATVSNIRRTAVNVGLQS